MKYEFIILAVFTIIFTGNVINCTSTKCIPKLILDVFRSAALLRCSLTCFDLFRHKCSGVVIFFRHSVSNAHAKAWLPSLPIQFLNMQFAEVVNHTACCFKLKWTHCLALKRNSSERNFLRTTYLTVLIIPASVVIY